MAQLLKLWHQYGFLITIGGYLILLGVNIANHNNAMAAIQLTQATMEQQHDKENVDHRVTVLEQIAVDNHDNIEGIKQVQGKIFERINQIADDR